LWDELFISSGCRWDQQIENKVLSDAADIIGHSGIDTLLRSYLDKALLEYFGVQRKSQLAELRSTWQVIQDVRGNLQPSDVQLIRETIVRVAHAGPEFKAVLSALMEHPDYVPSAAEPTEARPGRTQLRLVPTSSET
jgi:hypothetical protein